MERKLEKPFTSKEKADFVVKYNHNSGLKIEETDTALFALNDCEIIQDNEMVDISSTEEYQNKIRLKEIEQELINADITYETYLETPVSYTNGNKYKPKWAQDTYIALLTAGNLMPSRFPTTIWDSTELEENAVSMTLAELTSLTAYLADLQQAAFDSRKAARAALLIEKSQLGSSN